MPLADIKSYIANPSSLPTGGSYGEGQAYNAATVFQALKNQVTTGALSLTDYQDLAGQFAKSTNQLIGSISSKGSAAANAVKGAWNTLNGTYLDGNGKMLNPFTPQELSQLPAERPPVARRHRRQRVNLIRRSCRSRSLRRLEHPPPRLVIRQRLNANARNPTAAPPARPTSNTRHSGCPSRSATTAPAAPSRIPLRPLPRRIRPETTNHDLCGPTRTKPAGVLNSPIYTQTPNNPGPSGGIAIDNSQGSQDAQAIANQAAMNAQLSTPGRNKALRRSALPT